MNVLEQVKTEGRTLRKIPTIHDGIDACVDHLSWQPDRMRELIYAIPDFPDEGKDHYTLIKAWYGAADRVITDDEAKEFVCKAYDAYVRD